MLESFERVVAIAASAVFLALAVLTATRGRRESALALPTALLCADLFAYLGFEVVGELTEAAPWEWLEAAAAAASGALLFHLVLAFVGARRTHRAALVVVYAYFGAVALSSLAPLAQPAWAAYPGGERWALAMLGGTVPAFALAAFLLVRYHRRAAGEERARTQLFVAAVAVGVGGAASDLASLAGAPAIPHLAGPGMLLSALLLSALALRARFVAGGVRTAVVTALLVAVLGVVAQLVVFRAFGGATAALVIGTLLVSLVVLAAARAIWSAATEVRERTAHLATLGRLSAQMAHDIRNPLAAIRGAAQYLEEELRRGGALADQAELIELIVEQSARLDRVVDEYGRLGRAKARRAATDVDALVEGVAERAQRALATGATIAIRAEPGAAGEAQLDAELVTTALENLVRNAVEALGARGGAIVVGARRDGARVELSVADDGPGMDARTLERADQDFFTTKADGSGLGLAFARRVAEAHGGALAIESASGRGTTVRLRLLDVQPTP